QTRLDNRQRRRTQVEGSPRSQAAQKGKAHHRGSQGIGAHRQGYKGPGTGEKMKWNGWNEHLFEKCRSTPKWNDMERLERLGRKSLSNRIFNRSTHKTVTWNDALKSIVSRPFRSTPFPRGA